MIPSSSSFLQPRSIALVAATSHGPIIISLLRVLFPIVRARSQHAIQLLYHIIVDILPGALPTRLEHAARTSRVADCFPLLSLGLLTMTWTVTNYIITVLHVAPGAGTFKGCVLCNVHLMQVKTCRCPHRSMNLCG